MSRMSLVAIAMSMALQACAYWPLSRQFTSWSAESCHRKTFIDRFCSGLVTTVTSPIHLAALVVDLPLTIFEFWFGWAPYDDPLVKTGSIDFEKHRFPTPDGEWEVQRLVYQPESFDVKKIEHGVVTRHFEMTPAYGGQLRVKEYSVTSDMRAYTSLDTY